MFSFGENEIYDQVANPEGSLIRRIQNTLQTIIGLAPCIFIGRGVFQYSFGIVPFRKPIYTVGKLSLCPEQNVIFVCIKASKRMQFLQHMRVTLEPEDPSPIFLT